jgi:hypothetical protein
MLAIADWLEAHPAIVSLVLVPLVMALVNAVLRPRTPEEYAALPPRFSAVLKFLRAVFPDPQKAAQAAAQVLSGSNEKPTPKNPG